MTEASFYVYLWTNKVNGKMYVGKGHGRRAIRHLSARSRSVFHSAIRKHGRDSFELRYLLTDVDEATALAAEQHVIYVLESRVPNGYNVAPGGEGYAGFKHTDEARRKMSAKGKGRPKTSEHRKKISEANRGKQRSQEWCDRLSLALRGKGKGVPRPLEHMAAAREAHRKPEALRQHILTLYRLGVPISALLGLGVSKSAIRRWVKKEIENDNGQNPISKSA